MLKDALQEFHNARLVGGDVLGHRIALGLEMLTEAMINGAEAQEVERGETRVTEGVVVDGDDAFEIEGDPNNVELFDWALGKKVRVTVEVIP